MALLLLLLRLLLLLIARGLLPCVLGLLLAQINKENPFQGNEKWQASSFWTRLPSIDMP
jgi:hypothetical protein